MKRDVAFLNKGQKENKSLQVVINFISVVGVEDFSLKIVEEIWLKLEMRCDFLLSKFLMVLKIFGCLIDA